MKLDRLIGILTILLQSDKSTAPELATRFGVSRRTILRDIDTLGLAGIPVVTTQGEGGGISIMEGYKIRNSVLTAEELGALVAGLKGIDSVSKQSRFEGLMAKLAPSGAAISLREPVIIDLASYYKGQLTGKIELIKRAVLETRLIEFDYYYEKGENHRCIEPYFVIFQWSSWYVFGFCQARRDWRMFKLLRLWNLSLCDEHYTPRGIPPERLDWGAHFTDDIKLVAVFEKSERYKLIESYGLDCYTETAEGLHMEIAFTNHDVLLGWLLGFGGNVRVLEPKSIADDVKAAAEKILSRYH